MDRYFKWLCQEVTDDHKFSDLLGKLYETEFTWNIDMDENRAFDGVDLRASYEHETDRRCDISGPCTVLEMMIALSSRMENIMHDGTYGNRTAQWFWEMIASLGLGKFDNSHYIESEVDLILERFLLRRYNRDGKGGLFIIPNCDHDLRDVEIWYQMNWYLNQQLA